VKENELELIYVRTSEQVVDIFTKPLKAEVFWHLQKKVGVMMFEETSLKWENIEC
jgi:hypothetical protein